MEINWRFVLAATAAIGTVAVCGYAAASYSSPSKKKSKKIKETKEEKTIAREMRSSNSTIVNEEEIMNLTESIESPVFDGPMIEQVPQESEQQKLTASAALKEKGNQYFKNKQFNEAIIEYTKAIEMIPTAVYFGNRAACFFGLGDYENVLLDCTEAIKLDEKYVKAFSRRAQAYEKLGKKKDAVNDLTVVCILQNFAESPMAAADRLLKEIAAEQLPKYLNARSDQYVPSINFTQTFLESFKRTRRDLKELKQMQSDTDGEKLVTQAISELDSQEYQNAFQLLQQASKMEMSSTHQLICYSLLATLQFVRAQTQESFEFLDKALLVEPNDIDSLIKKATVFMEKGEIPATFECYEKAEKLTSEHPDLFYHRGQLRFLTGNIDGAIEDYEKAIEVEPEFMYSYIQLAVALYKAGRIGESLKVFTRATRKFPERAQVPNFHGEVLMDQGKFGDALNLFDKAIEMDSKCTLAYINKGILTAQWKQNFAEAEQLLREAINIDPASDTAYVHLGQVLLAQNRIDAAIKIYDEALVHARTDVEMLNLIVCREAANAQGHVSRNYPMLVATLK